MRRLISKRDMLSALGEYLRTIRNYSPRDGYHDDGSVTLPMVTVNRIDHIVWLISAAEYSGTQCSASTEDIVSYLKGEGELTDVFCGMWDTKEPTGKRKRKGRRNGSR